MIVKVQTEQHKDRFLVEAAYIRWVDQADFVILEIHIVSTESKRVDTTALSYTSIQEDPSLRLRVNDGDHVYIMNNDGKTIDSKTILTSKESRREARQTELEIRGYRNQCGSCADNATCKTATTRTVPCPKHREK